MIVMGIGALVLLLMLAMGGTLALGGVLGAAMVLAMLADAGWNDPLTLGWAGAIAAVAGIRASPAWPWLRRAVDRATIGAMLLAALLLAAALLSGAVAP